MLKRIGAGVAVLAVTALTLLAAPAAAQAATPTTATQEQDCLTPLKAETDAVAKGLLIESRIPCRQVKFEDKCDGSVAVTFTNANDSEHALSAEFFIGALGWTVAGGESVTTTVPKSDDEIVVRTRYPSPNGEKVDLISHTWERPDGCWEITAKNLCDGNIALSVKNTAVVDGVVGIQVDTLDAVETFVPAGETFTANHKVLTVVVVYDKDSSKTFHWTQPVCTTPTPSTVPTTAPPVGRDTSGDLPATGAAGAGMSVVGGTIALFAALAGGFALWFVRRSRRQTSQSS